jgi:hypothetical protein
MERKLAEPKRRNGRHYRPLVLSLALPKLNCHWQARSGFGVTDNASAKIMINAIESLFTSVGSLNGIELIV